MRDFGLFVVMLIADKKEDGVRDSVMIFAIFSIASADTPDPLSRNIAGGRRPYPQELCYFQS